MQGDRLFLSPLICYADNYTGDLVYLHSFSPALGQKGGKEYRGFSSCHGGYCGYCLALPRRGSVLDAVTRRIIPCRAGQAHRCNSHLRHNLQNAAGTAEKKDRDMGIQARPTDFCGADHFFPWHTFEPDHCDHCSLILCEIISALSLDRKYETIFTVLACFSIGMGAALTPIGEPLSTIAIAKLRGGAHTADSLFLLKLVGIYIVPGIVFLSVVGALFRGIQVSAPESLTEDCPESMKVIALRAWKVYVFVMALILLGNGFKPVIDIYIAPLTARLLYWINISSAVLDNATLAAAELGSPMSRSQITGILMGVIISGGMLIPGNIPNIIAASKLKISSRSWAMIGLPVGLFLMCTYFFILFGI